MRNATDAMKDARVVEVLTMVRQFGIFKLPI